MYLYSLQTWLPMRLRLLEIIMDYSVIGKRIAAGRKNRGLSQAQFAELLYVTPQCVGKWERSQSLPDIFMLGKIGEVIGTTDINYFLGKPPCECVFCSCCKFDL